ncbi:hypothetical protein SDC9_210382 [bioreactor metagenome]|uniref:Uncharacterized protein n=1 Tax=bioreactor metagenome TaxID=1076179 RepID=A0A645JHQ2_9ZZZZ
MCRQHKWAHPVARAVHANVVDIGLMVRVLQKRSYAQTVIVEAGCEVGVAQIPDAWGGVTAQGDPCSRH